eukprot:NODE_7522_length_397_cov_84.267241_g5828_i2.p1 GENE.NODE_7522_length_397_cov_84.267241_g5828_i2~~NODE_7522_length_397_cov_84.267241_g5828_i2.p1  ORF type:complete len:131 (-),score=45.69 NODE_7522_length_397_cov_84.267241_g5828_i2:4-363(-)
MGGRRLRVGVTRRRWRRGGWLGRATERRQLSGGGHGPVLLLPGRLGAACWRVGPTVAVVVATDFSAIGRIRFPGRPVLPKAWPLASLASLAARCTAVGRSFDHSGAKEKKKKKKKKTLR